MEHQVDVSQSVTIVTVARITLGFNTTCCYRSTKSFMSIGAVYIAHFLGKGHLDPIGGVQLIPAIRNELRQESEMPSHSGLGRSLP